VPTLNQVRNKVDNWLAVRWPTVQGRQEAYLLAHGRYWQGLRTHTFDLAYTTQVDAEANGNALTDHPTDQTESWLDFVPEWGGTALPAVFVMDVYQSPAGWGYVATVTVLHNGTRYRRSQNVGSETWRTQAWVVVTPEVI
jgi:hypothetical protein